MQAFALGSSHNQKSGAAKGLVWAALIVPPLLFSLILLIAVFPILKVHSDSQEIDAAIEYRLPYVLMVNHTLLFFGLLWILRREGLTLVSIGWQLRDVRTIALEIVGGLSLGIIFRLVDRFALSALSRGILALVGVREAASANGALHALPPAAASATDGPKSAPSGPMP
jgi:hypothetical protein